MSDKRFNKIKGTFWEIYVCLVYLLRGYRILARGKRNRFAEMDILAYKRNVLILIEVKYRKTERAATEALTYAQIERLRKALNAEAAALRFNGGLRCDYVAVFGYGSLRRIENAF